MFFLGVVIFNIIIKKFKDYSKFFVVNSPIHQISMKNITKLAETIKKKLYSRLLNSLT